MISCNVREIEEDDDELLMDIGGLWKAINRMLRAMVQLVIVGELLRSCHPIFMRILGTTVLPPIALICLPCAWHMASSIHFY